MVQLTELVHHDVRHTGLTFECDRLGFGQIRLEPAHDVGERIADVVVVDAGVLGSLDLFVFEVLHVLLDRRILHVERLPFLDRRRLETRLVALVGHDRVGGHDHDVGVGHLGLAGLHRVAGEADQPRNREQQCEAAPSPSSDPRWGSSPSRRTMR